MARKPKEVKNDIETDEEVSEADIYSMMKEIRKATGSSSLTESKTANITDYINTGDMGLNVIISGKVDGGIPVGRITTFFGPTSSGKSLVASNCIVNAFKIHKYHRVFIFDTEGGTVLTIFKEAGVDTDKIEQVLCGTIEEAHVNIVRVLDKIEKLKEKNPKLRILCVLDSLGALSADKVTSDAVEKNKMAGDMGANAKLRNALMRALTVPVMRAQVPFLILNHAYENPGQMHPTKIKEQAGGKGVQFSSHVIVQMDKRLEKDENKKDTDQFYNKTYIKAFTTKNRLIKPFMETEICLSAAEIQRSYFGLFPFAVKFGFITIPSQGFYKVPSYSDKAMRAKELLNTPEVWDTFIPALDAKLQVYMSYGCNIPNPIEDDEEDFDVDALE